MDKAPKFCGECGRSLKMKVKTMRYNKQTGKPVNWVKVYCKSFGAIMGIGSHTKKIYDEAGEEVSWMRLHYGG